MGASIFGYLSRALQKGAAEGILRNGFDTEQVALILWACMIGVYNMEKKNATI